MSNTTEHIEELYDKAKNYTETSIALYKLNAIDTAADVLSSLAGRVILISVLAIFTLFLSIGISLYIGQSLGEYYLGFLIVSGFYLFLGILIYFFKKPWIIDPIANLTIEKLMRTKSKPNEIVMEKLEADEIIS